MTLEETTKLYAALLRQLLPIGGYDNSPDTTAAIDIYAHAKLLAQADLDGKRLLAVLEAIPEQLLAEYEREYGLPLKCTVNATRSLKERLQILSWVRQTRNVLNHSYLVRLLALFGIEQFELVTYRPMQSTGACTSAVNTEHLRYKVALLMLDSIAADMDCIIHHYLPGYLRVDIRKISITFHTSQPYPIENIETIGSTLALNDGIHRDIYHAKDTSESISTFFSLGNAVLGSNLNSIAASIEAVSTAFVMKDALLYRLMNNVSAEIEAVNTRFVIENGKLEDLLTSIAISPEAVTTSFSMGDSSLKTLVVSNVMPAESISTFLIINDAILG